MFMFMRNNLDGILNIAVIFIIAFLNFVDFVDAKTIDVATLIVLALLAFSNMATRQINYNLKLILQQLNKNMDIDDSVLASGIRRIYPTFNADMFDEKCQNASQKIDVLTTWLSEVNMGRKLTSVIAQQKVPVRLLILDPKSLYARSRAQNVLGNEELPFHYFRSMLILMNNLDLNKKVQIRVYNQNPPISLYIVDEWMLVGRHWAHGTSSQLPHEEIEGCDSMIGEHLIETYESIWQSSMDLDDYIDYLVKNFPTDYPTP